MAMTANVKRFLFYTGAALLVYIAYQFIELRAGNYVTAVNHADSIVVLGAAVWPEGRPSPVLRDRILRAAELYREGVAGTIICTGGTGKHPPAEAEVCKQLLVTAGVPEQEIITETTSASTREQAKRIKEIYEQKGFRSMALVTSFFHEKRAALLFSREGLTDIEDARCTHERFEDLNYWVAREALALAAMNWWCWATVGLGISVLTWLYRLRRQRAHL
ncbi:MAG TPA: YdcF family protein [Pyrinomonadaceae bacterium]|nr:YdcF family protein [Pyrinomonadaceae bacterium]